jgi:hypothetical protein
LADLLLRYGEMLYIIPTILTILIIGTARCFQQARCSRRDCRKLATTLTTTAVAAAAAAAVAAAAAAATAVGTMQMPMPVLQGLHL